MRTREELLAQFKYDWPKLSPDDIERLSRESKEWVEADFKEKDRQRCVRCEEIERRINSPWAKLWRLAVSVGRSIRNHYVRWATRREIRRLKASWPPPRRYRVIGGQQ